MGTSRIQGKESIEDWQPSNCLRAKIWSSFQTKSKQEFPIFLEQTLVNEVEIPLNSFSDKSLQVPKVLFNGDTEQKNLNVLAYDDLFQPCLSRSGDRHVGRSHIW